MVKVITICSLLHFSVVFSIKYNIMTSYYIGIFLTFVRLSGYQDLNFNDL